jgi:exopolysaccharide production protein ExoY
MNQYEQLTTTVKARKHTVYRFFKRLFDIVLTIPLLLLFIVAYIVLFPFYCIGEMKGPVLFKQQRLGRNGKLFYIYKFRTMVVNAEKILEQSEELYAQYVQNNYKLNPTQDPRTTKLGRFLRASSIDELPQLLNILKGEMSFVGPRPIVETELEFYGYRSSDLLQVKPGLTGYWQVSGRSTVHYPKRADLELYYVENCSFRLDLLIILKTVKVVFTKNGAY